MKNWMLRFALSLSTLFFTVSCSDSDDDGNREKANAEVYITDAPIDNAGVKGAFVTITGVKVNGTSVADFNAVTIDLMQYQNGEVKLLGALETEARSNSRITLELDYETDAEGNAPGCYVLTEDDVKHVLESGNKTLNLSHEVEVVANMTNELIVDFDLRKTIRSNASAASDFAFVSRSAMENAIRVVNKERTGEISGTVSNRAEADGDIIVAYAYKKGTYSESEVDENGEGVRFSGAVTSTVVNNTSGQYRLTFLEEGDYELHFASYARSSVTGQAEFRSSLTVETLLDLNILNLQLTSSVNLSVNVAVTGTVN